MLAIGTLAAGCASQDGPGEPNEQRIQCPPNTTMRCFKRTPAPEECSCVSQQKIEELLDL